MLNHAKISLNITRLIRAQNSNRIVRTNFIKWPLKWLLWLMRERKTAFQFALNETITYEFRLLIRYFRVPIIRQFWESSVLQISRDKCKKEPLGMTTDFCEGLDNAPMKTSTYILHNQKLLRANMYALL